MPAIFTYQKADKLKSRKQTQHLFSKGSSITVFPIKLIYTIESLSNLLDEAGLHKITAAGLLQAGVGATTRNFRKAVQRNRVKRLLREAYRLEKPHFLSQISLANKRVNLFFLYSHSDILSQSEIQNKVRTLLAQLVQKVNTTQ